jgi:hypothetical protein
MEQARIDLEDKIKRGESDPVLRAWYDHLHSPEKVRDEKMDSVELRLYEELGGASGKTCAVENTFTCPYGEDSESLIEDGQWIKDDIWCHLHWYHNHWNRQTTFTPPSDEMKWYRWDEPSIIDLTSKGLARMASFIQLAMLS